MFEVIWSLLALVVTLGILVTFHEFGHFWVARKNGVKVLKFSVGFGKPIWSRMGQDGTLYQVARIPLGGYVQMLDERVDEVAEADRPLSFNSKSIGQRAAIIAAGPLANFLLAIVVLWGMYLIGVPTVKPVIGSVQSNSIAAAAELPVNAEIIGIDGVPTRDWQEVNLAFAGAIGQDTAELELRLPSGRTSRYQLDLEGWRLSDEQVATFRQLGIEPFRPQPTQVLAQIAENSPAAAAGLEVGDKIIRIDGTLMSDWSQTQEFIGQNPGRTLVFEVERDSQRQTLEVSLGRRQPTTDAQELGYLGVVPSLEPYPEAYQFVHRYGPLDGLVEGAQHTWRLMTLSVEMLGKLVTGTVSIKHLSGPVAIAEGAGVSASYGLVYFLGFLALISVNLGIINLLPLPVLDGGHLVFLGLEKLKGRPVSERTQEIAYRIGGALIFALMAIAISNDILRLVS
ncbi:sigma E protease regulator RseP [Pseudidiomarina taiwanensis]|uniref:Zinc metalloprotease n=1 Tax=Pseudidiomarina taiwanensis TaxID=337250 RepID=A0A432ZNS1_9GAMM|nr:sigma E protease regulator RseP [Pseudidiomarina taiwanensis]RUO79486.1 zinc metallopeptidase RseP [Pseudidiomarina taiwanensis]